MLSLPVCKVVHNDTMPPSARQWAIESTRYIHTTFSNQITKPDQGNFLIIQITSRKESFLNFPSYNTLLHPTKFRVHSVCVLLDSTSKFCPRLPYFFIRPNGLLKAQRHTQPKPHTTFLLSSSDYLGIQSQINLLRVVRGVKGTIQTEPRGNILFLFRNTSGIRERVFLCFWS